MRNTNGYHGFRSPVTIAMYEGICKLCGEKIKRGDEIIRINNDVWKHAH